MHDAETPSSCFVVGLGNPGRKYRRTRHNLGFEVVARCVERWQADGPREAFAGLVYQARCRRGDAARKVVLLAPQTYMNRSGQAVGEMMRFHKAGVEDLLVVLDDMALPPGEVRIRAGGSAGGHNGLTDVHRALGTQDVPRLRIGIGPAPARMDPADYVLGKIGPDEETLLAEGIEQAARAVETWLFDGVRTAMDTYNRKATPDQR